MNPFDKVQFGRTNLQVTPFGFGTAPIGNIFREIDEQTSDAMIQHAWDAGIRYYDTAPMYGHGLAELRTGHSLRWKEREEFILSSKVGRILKPARKKDIEYAPWTNAGRFTTHFDYSYDGTMRAFEDSLQRLNLEYMDICFIHDIDVFTRGDEQPEVFKAAMDGAWKALSKLRDECVVKAIGVGVNEWEVCHAALEQRDFDCFLLAAILFWNRTRSTSSCRFAKSVAPQWWSVAASIPAYLQQGPSKGRNTIMRPPRLKYWIG